MLLTPDAALVSIVEEPRPKFLAEILNNAGADSRYQLTLASFNPSRRNDSFVDFVGEEVGLVDNRPASRRYDGVVALYSRDATQHIADIRDGLFASEFDGREYIENRRNFLIRSFGRLIKNLLILRQAMSKKTTMEAAVLPSKNFQSEAFKSFLQHCQEQAQSRDFQNQVVPALTAVTKLRGPRRRSTYPTKYFRDDRALCFQYGHEMHSSFETGGAHSTSCSIRGLFRFGIPLEQQRHFNVVCLDDKKAISGVFQICHDERLNIKDRTHLNMFSNDFVK